MMSDDVKKALDSIRQAMVFSSRDWSLSSGDAWIYAIAVGWGDCLDGLAGDHRWNTAAVARLRKMRAAVAALTGDEDDG